MNEYSERIALRLTKQQRSSINLLVRVGRYKDLTQFVRQAIGAYLSIQDLNGARYFVKQLENLENKADE